MFTRLDLEHLYIEEKLSMVEVAHKLATSPGTVAWWMRRYDIPRRSHSDATYVKHNGLQDPFTIKRHLTPQDRALFALGIGLYWGEGNKVNPYSVRLGNTDPALLRIFIRFLKEICGVSSPKIRLGLQVFNDGNGEVALQYWQKQLECTRDSFMPKVKATTPRRVNTV